MFDQRLASCLAIASLTACGGSGSGVQSAGDPAGAAAPQSAVNTTRAEQIGGALTCTEPVSADDTARSLLDRFGESAEIGVLAGGEGTEIPGVLLWPDDPKHRLEIGFESEARKALKFIRIGAESEWEIAGIALGDTLEDVVAINQAPIDFFGFDWDYAGTVAEFEDGQLKQLEGGCELLMSLTYDDTFGDLPQALIGERLIPSDSEDIPDGALKVSELGLGFRR